MKNIIIIIIVGVVASIGLFLLYWYNKPANEIATNAFMNNPPCTTNDGKQGRVITSDINNPVANAPRSACVPLVCITRPGITECKQFSALLATGGRG